MSIQTRNIIIVLFLGMSFVPFVLLTDLFPFMRFGMFAETITNNSQQELFEILIQKKDGSTELLSQRQQGMDDSHLNYLTRTYFYANKISFLTEEISKSELILPQEKIIIRQKILVNGALTSKIITP